MHVLIFTGVEYSEESNIRTARGKKPRERVMVKAGNIREFARPGSCNAAALAALIWVLNINVEDEVEESR